MANPLGRHEPRDRRIEAPGLHAAGTPSAGGTGPTCRCGHGRQAHEHYRRGSDCALCTCRRFHRPLLQRLRLRGR